MFELSVSSRGGDYPVSIGRGFGGLAGRVGGSSPPVVVTDTHVGPLWADALRRELPDARLLVVPAGESTKSWSGLEQVVEGLLALGVDRGTWVLALGGGVIGDLAGLAASLSLRGLPWAVLPTSLLAMVDASVGGKTAINGREGKNLVGTFHAPRFVWAAVDTLATLPAAERCNGMGEVIKTAVVGDAELLGELGELSDEALVRRCVAVKAAVVGADEREQGVRAWLNAGHTVGHALERATGFGALGHGEAVGLGLVAETRWAVSEGICLDPTLPDRILAALHDVGCATVAPRLPRDAVLAAMQLDKKADGDTMSLPVPVRAGHMVVVRRPRTDLSSLLDHLPT